MTVDKIFVDKLGVDEKTQHREKQVLNIFTSYKALL
jgi:hypothetical protein